MLAFEVIFLARKLDPFQGPLRGAFMNRGEISALKGRHIIARGDAPGYIIWPLQGKKPEKTSLAIWTPQVRFVLAAFLKKPVLMPSTCLRDWQG